MSDTKPDLDAIERQLTDDPTDLGVKTARALVAYARTLEADNERLRGERDEADDTANMRLGMVRSARRRAEAAEAERDHLRDTLARRSAAHDRLTQRLDQVRALVSEIGDGISERTLAEWLTDVQCVLDGDQGQP